MLTLDDFKEDEKFKVIDKYDYPMTCYWTKLFDESILAVNLGDCGGEDVIEVTDGEYIRKGLKTGYYRIERIK